MLQIFSFIKSNFNKEKMTFPTVLTMLTCLSLSQGFLQFIWPHILVLTVALWVYTVMVVMMRHISLVQSQIRITKYSTSHATSRRKITLLLLVHTYEIFHLVQIPDKYWVNIHYATSLSIFPHITSTGPLQTNKSFLEKRTHVIPLSDIYSTQLTQE